MSDLPPPPPPNPAPAPQAASSTRPWLIPLVVILAVAGVSIAFLLGRESSDDASNAAINSSSETTTDAVTTSTAPSPVKTPDDAAVSTNVSTTPATTAPATTAPATTTTVEPATTPVTIAPGPVLFGGYVTLDGSDPLPTECEGLAGICLRLPLETLIAQLGPPAERFEPIPGETGMTQAWNVEGIRLIVDTDGVDAVSRIVMTWRQAPATRTSVGMGPVVGGGVTPADVVSYYGQVGEYTLNCLENTQFTTFDFGHGPEDSVTVQYGITGEFGSGCQDDPGSAEGLLTTLGDVPLADVTVF